MNNANGYNNNDNFNQNPYDFQGPPKYVPPKYNKPGINKGFLALFVSLCLLFGVAGYAFGLVFNRQPMANITDNSSTESSIVSSDNENTSVPAEESAAFNLEVVNPETYYTIKSVVNLTINSVVEISTETITTGSFMRQYITNGAGSGVIITKDGYIVTNNHVVEGASTITVRLHNGSEYPATLVGTDAETDIAVIKIDENNLSTAVLGDSKTLEVGDQVIAIGNPLGKLGGTVTEGIISALERPITVDGKDMTLIQHSAAVNPGNSGGGLFNTAGQLVGIVNAKYSEDNVEGLGFAIPTAIAVPIIEDIMNYGYVRGRVSLGTNLLDIYSNYYTFYYGVPEYGTYVYSVYSGSDADKAGIKKGDRIDSVNGNVITGSAQIEDILKKASVGDELVVVVTRFTSSGRQTVSKQYTFTVKLTEYKPQG